MTICRMAACCALLSASATVGCTEPSPYVKPPTPVTATQVLGTNPGTSVRYSGIVKPALEVAAAFKVGGYVEDILTVPDDRGRMRDVQEGDHVAKGAALARLRAADYQQRVAQTRSGLAEAEAMAESARLDFDRASRLYERRSFTKPDFDAAKARLDATAAKVEGARAMVSEAEIPLDDVVLRSPIDGVVLKRAIERGSLASPGQNAFTLADTSSVKVSFGVPDVVVTSLAMGRPQRMTFDALKDQEFEGRITSIAPAPDPVSRVYEIEVTVPNPRRQIAVGFITSLQLADAHGTVVPTVPLEAIVKPAKGTAEYGVFLLEGPPDHEVARLRPVTLGPALGNTIVVTSGLTIGQQVIIRGATLVVDGETVRVLPPPTTP